MTGMKDHSAIILVFIYAGQKLVLTVRRLHLRLGSGFNPNEPTSDVCDAYLACNNVARHFAI